MSQVKSLSRAYSGRFHNIYLFVTERCQLRCGHCYMGDRLEKGRFFETTRAISVLQYWRRMGARFLTLVGGEPTLHPDLPQIVAAAAATGFEKVMIDTNALLPERIFPISPDTLYYVRVSLDGATAETHDRVRGQGNFAKAIAGIQRLNEAGYTLRLTTTIFDFNQFESAAIVQLAHALGIQVVNFHSFTPEGCGLANAGWAMSPMDWYQFCQRLEREVANSPVEVRFPPTWVKQEDLPNLSQKGFQGCLGCSLDRISVLPDGRCYVCSLLFDHDVHFGEVSDNGFILNTKAVKNEFELFTEAAFQADDPLAMGCPAEIILGMNPNDLQGLIPVCRLWRKTAGSSI